VWRMGRGKGRKSRDELFELGNVVGGRQKLQGMGGLCIFDIFLEASSFDSIGDSRSLFANDSLCLDMETLLKSTLTQCQVIRLQTMSGIILPSTYPPNID
jgi:hypothetical protein